jgi:hypothetical protein
MIGLKSSLMLVCAYVCVLLRIVYMHVGRNFISLDSISKSKLTYFEPNRWLLVALLRNRCSR